MLVRKLIKKTLVAPFIFTVYSLLWPLYGADATITVSAFSNFTGNSELDYLSGAIPEQVATTLAQTSGIKVIEQSSPASSGAMYIVKGSFSGTKNNLKVQIRIISTKSGSVVASGTVQGDTGNILEKVSESARALAKSIAGTGEAVSEASLTLISQPSEAEVYIDGAYAGLTPLNSYSVTPGRHQVTIEKKGYQSEKFLITLKKGESKELTKSLQPLKRTQYFYFGGSIFYLENPFGNTWKAGSIFAQAFFQVQVKAIRFGLDFSYAPSQYHTYKYSIPYGEATDNRYYTYLQGAFSIDYLPFYKWKTFTPYFGARAGLWYFWDFRNNDTTLQVVKSNTKLLLAPKVGILFFPQSTVNFFIEGQYMYMLPQLRRQVITEATLFSGVSRDYRYIDISMFIIGGGMSVKF